MSDQTVSKGLTKDLKKLVDQISQMTTSKDKNLLELVSLKGKGYGFYYSPQSRTFVQVHRNNEMYLLPVDKDEEGKYYIFVPRGIFSGEVILVTEEDINFLGFN